MASEVLYREHHDGDGSVVSLVRDEHNNVVAVRKDAAPAASTGVDRSSMASQFMRQVFLPEGYPNSVSDDYLEYQVWDTVQAFASSISGSLATKAVLKGIGVGDKDATPMAAAITWLLQDGAGMISQITFTWIQGSDLDYNCKKWRLFADIMNDGAMLLELTSPLWPKSAVQFVLCTSGVARSLVSVAGGATRAAVTNHQARANNISDVAAKDKSQETLVNLAALAINLMVVPFLDEDSLGLTWFLFLLLTCLHLFANYRAVKSLRFATLNKQRILHVVREYDTKKRTLSIEKANQRESVVIGFGLREKGVLGRRINLGASLAQVLQKHSRNGTIDSSLARRVLDQLPSRGHACLASRDSIDVILGPDSDVLKAYLQACVLARSGELAGDGGAAVAKETEVLVDALKEAGWELEYAQLATLGWAQVGEDK